MHPRACNIVASWRSFNICCKTAHTLKDHVCTAQSAMHIARPRRNGGGARRRQGCGSGLCQSHSQSAKNEVTATPGWVCSGSRPAARLQLVLRRWASWQTPLMPPGSPLPHRRRLQTRVLSGGCGAKRAVEDGIGSGQEVREQLSVHCLFKPVISWPVSRPSGTAYVRCTAGS